MPQSFPNRYDYAPLLLNGFKSHFVLIIITKVDQERIIMPGKVGQYVLDGALLVCCSWPTFQETMAPLQEEMIAGCSHKQRIRLLAGLFYDGVGFFFSSVLGVDGQSPPLVL